MRLAASITSSNLIDYVRLLTGEGGISFIIAEFTNHFAIAFWMRSFISSSPMSSASNNDF